MKWFGSSQVVLALGGGGSRGLAHLGVLQVLEKHGIPVAGVVGTSVGAIVGAAYCLRPDATRLIDHSMRYLRSDRFMHDHFRRMMFGSNEVEQNFFQSVLSNVRKSLTFTSLIRRRSIFDGDRLRDLVGDLVEDKTFEQTQIPFAVPAIDLRPPMEVLLTTGPLRPAVTASCSLPGFFPPVEMSGMLLADIGVIGSVPVQAARQLVPGAVVVAVDISTELAPMQDVSRGWECIMRVEAIAAKKLNELELGQADVVLRPRIGRKYWSDFTELDMMVQAGADEAELRIEDVRSRLQRWLPFRR
ncbi:MAG: patatin-like phospholipase family protein [Planctomycetota bacterium]